MEQSKNIPRYDDEIIVRSLYKELLESWNNHDAAGYAKLFSQNANVIGFDGSQLKGSEQVRDEVGNIFEHHEVGSYVSIIKECRPLSATVFVVHAVAGMIPSGDSRIKPELNAVQLLVAVKQQQSAYKIAIFQNTPAAFHGRPEMITELTGELQNLAMKKEKVQ